jgi:hypothetical protein
MTLVLSLGVTVLPDGRFLFSFAQPGGPRASVARECRAREGGWIGAKVGLFHLATQPSIPGHADFQSFIFSPPNAV